MSSPLARAVMRKDWVAAYRLLGTPFPFEWRSDGWQWLKAQATSGEDDDRFVVWGTRLALGAVDGPARGPVLAEVGFHGPPDPDGSVEIGYRVVSRHRRRGLAEEAVTAVLSWAAAHGADGVKASVSPDNVASIALLHKLAFTATGSYRHPVLGEQLSFRRVARALP
ncbi:MAG: GNAT family N-acetyltransferase [Actinomycetota bacterium]|nr:GNAT family N-acetyltransferase [Actinomycetota bacterium]